MSFLIEFLFFFLSSPFVSLWTFICGEPLRRKDALRVLKFSRPILGVQKKYFYIFLKEASIWKMNILCLLLLIHSQSYVLDMHKRCLKKIQFSGLEKNAEILSFWLEFWVFFLEFWVFFPWVFLPKAKNQAWCKDIEIFNWFNWIENS